MATITPPLMTEMRHARLIRSVLLEQSSLIVVGARKIMPGVVEQAAPIRKDAANPSNEDWSAAIFRLFAEVGAAMMERILRLPPDVATLAAGLDRTHREQWMNIVRQRYGVNLFREEPWLLPLMKAWERENVRLIGNMAEESRARLQGAFNQAVQEGTSLRQLTATVRERTGVDSRRASFIARDQIGKLNGQLTERRQIGLGVDKYRWRTSRDERVRPSHRAHAGRIYEWSKPPADTGHPGMDYRCRCTAEAIFPEIDEILGDMA